jgi:hypothetical protein
VLDDEFGNEDANVTLRMVALDVQNLVGSDFHSA